LLGFNSYRRSHFAPAFFLLPASKRKALQVLYEVCRQIDDAVDESNESPDAVLNAWDKFFRDHDAQVLGPFGLERLANEFLSVVTSFGLPWNVMADLIHKGVGVDLNKSRFQTPMDTESYCYGVAGTVGIACLPIFGVPVEEGRAYATRLGIAIQWVNLIRDVGEDAAMGRIYLPIEHLERFNYSESDLLSKKKLPAFDSLMRFEAEVARSHFKRAHELFPLKWEKELKPARVMGTIYAALLLKLERSRFPVFDRQIRLNMFEKAAATIKAVTRRN